MKITPSHPSPLEGEGEGGGAFSEQEITVNHRGATLIEMLIVTGLMAILLAIGVGSVREAAARQAGQTAAAEVAVELRAARLLAITRREPMRVRFVGEAGLVRVEPAGSPGTAVREYSYGLRGIRLAEFPSGGTVTFYPSGRTASPATITLSNARGELFRITVSLVGRVSL
jgi:type IV fimbrial biogenesis protein FimT